MYWTKGGINLEQCGTMPFDRFEKYIDEAVRIQKESEPKHE